MKLNNRELEEWEVDIYEELLEWGWKTEEISIIINKYGNDYPDDDDLKSEYLDWIKVEENWD